MSLNKLELPDNIKDFAPAAIKLDADGEWHITQPDGSVTQIDVLLNQSKTSSTRLALVLRDIDLPKDLHQFDKLPSDWPVFIQGKNNRLFELTRGKSTTLIYNKVLLRVKNTKDIRQGLWMLQRPSKVRATRFIKLDKKTTSPLPANTQGPGFVVESMKVEDLMSLMRSAKNQTLVISGRIIDGKLFSVSMKELQAIAADNDIKLVVLDSDRPGLVLKKVSRSMRRAAENQQMQFDTMGDFFNRLAVSDSRNKLELQTSSSGENQMAIQWKVAKSVSEDRLVDADVLVHMPVHLLLHSALVTMPDRARSHELDNRIIPNIPSMIQFYVLISVVLGFTALGTSWKLWRKIWLLKTRREYSNIMVLILLWPLHRLLFLLLFLPLLGMFSFIWLVMSVIYKVFDWTLIRPSRYLYRLLVVA